MIINILIRKIQRTYEDYGFRMTLRKIFTFLFSFLYLHITCRVYRKNIDDVQIPEKIDGGFSFRFLDKHDGKYIEQIERMEEWLSGKVKNKIESGNPCLVALVGGKVAGFNLVALSSVYLPLPRETIDLKKDEGWSEQITVHKDYRGQDLATNLRYKLFAELQKNNIKWLYGATLINNKNALKLARKLGFKEIVDIHFIRFLFFKKWRRIQLNDALNGNLFLNG